MKYVRPELEIVKFETEDVIVTSSITLRPDETEIVPLPNGN